MAPPIDPPIIAGKELEDFSLLFVSVVPDVGSIPLVGDPELRCCG